jgi:hypothetical protein
MPDRSHRTQSQTESSSTSTGSVSQAAPSNTAVAESVRTPEGTAAGLANYQAALGQWLGGELYGAVAEHLTMESMSGYANKALLGAFGAVSGSLENLDPANNKADLEKFSAAFKSEFGTVAGEWLAENGSGFSASLADWVDANPELIVAAALLAAAGAYLANADAPELSHAFKLGGYTAELGAKIGKLRELSLEQVSLELSHATAPLVAAIKVSPGGDQTKTEFSGTLGDSERNISTSGEFIGQDLAVLNVAGLLKTGDTTAKAGYKANNKPGAESSTLNVNFETENGGITRVRGAEYDTNTEVLTLRDVLREVDGSNSTSFERTSSSDGSQSEKVSLARDLGGGLSGTLALSEAAKQMGLGSSYELSTEQRASFGLKYDSTDLDAAMKMSLASSGNSAASGSVDYKNSTGWEMGGDAKVTFGNRDSLEAGAYFGFRNPDEFQTYMAKYRFKDDVSQTHDLDLMVEERFGPVYARVQQQVSLGLTGNSWSTTAQGAYFVSDNVALIGGAQYKKSSNGQESFAPQIGAQINGVPLVVTHDFETKTTTVGLTFRFGN